MDARAKSGAGIATPNIHKATQTRPASFFVSVPTHTQIMVARAGPTLVGPGSLCAGCCNPVRVTTSEIATSGGD
ncbi:ash family protein [Enterobacter hormaechei]|uniref:ash family protein n=1 Tax=Enterobacter hormaechei TaxID=158836 RepID=UPI0009B47F58|nr:ash family protein [Enterobacter hormaechei]MDR9967970.1 ash family protein [Enterobacter hormaechei subsp. xiangfangensis]